MKNFLRSVAGKTVLFVLVIIMFVTAAASAFSVALLAVYGFYDEKTDIESAKRRMEKEYFISYVQSDAYSAAFSVIRDGEEPYTPDSLDYAFYDETGKQLSTNYDAAVSANDDIWSYRVYIWKNETFFRTVGRFFSSVPLVPKTAVGALALTVAEFAFMLRFIYDPKYLIIIWVAEKLILIPLVIYSAVNLRKLQKAGKAVAEGNLEYKTDTRSLFGDFKRFGEDMNRISDGMSAEVEKRTHSDRMKTELITNVSHDLKTPLTSLVNYSDLICAEKCDNEKISEYAEVIHRQSLRLKRLIDDLVEASKAQSGVLDVCLAPCDVSTFVNQVSGEYGDRLASAELEPVIRLPSEPVYIFADPRRLLRVFDNLLTNICKYAKHGTRVYLDVAQDGNTARITFRNVSERALDIDGEELAERFVRADASRNTEGNGLGLSIAKSLVELQNGKMKITVDGDLFKVTLTFPLSKPVE